MRFLKIKAEELGKLAIDPYNFIGKSNLAVVTVEDEYTGTGKTSRVSTALEVVCVICINSSYVKLLSSSVAYITLAEMS